MTPIEIAYFKHFMYDKGLEKSFQYYYRKNPIKVNQRSDDNVNPESIEQFFLQTTVADVIMKAFTFYPSGAATRENSTFDYWKNIDDQWQDYMRSMAGNVINDSWPLLRKTFAILRQNWDVPGYWHKDNLESTEEVYKRMHIDLPLPENCWEHGGQPLKRHDAELIKFNLFDAKDGDIIVRIKKDENNKDFTIRLIILFREINTFDADGLTLYRLVPYAYYNINTRTLKIGDGVRVININPEAKDVTFRLAFPQEKQLLMDNIADAGLRWDETEKALISKHEEKVTIPELSPSGNSSSDLPEIDFVEFNTSHRVVNALNRGIISVNTRNHSWRVTINRIDTKEIKKKQLSYAMVGNTKAGETMLMLCNNSNGIPLTYNADNYYNINSRQFCDHLKRLLSISDDLVYLRIEKVSEKMDSITYKVTKQ